MQTAAFKNILVGLADDSQLRSPALDIAFDLAMLSDAHVTVQVDAIDAMPIDGMNYEGAFMIAAANDRIEADSATVTTRVRADAKARGLSCRVLSWTAAEFALRRNFVDLGRTHDLAILDAGRRDTVGRYTETALFETGRPVVVVPERINPLSIKRCLVAWDGSVEAARALNDALPVLHGMEIVEVLSVQKDGAEDRLRGVGLHLQRHGIKAMLRTAPIVGGSIGTTLAAHIDATRPGLVVMGAYSHSPMREWMLGGTTRAMLTSALAALFMSH